MSSEKQNKMPGWRDNLLQWEQSAGATEQKENKLWEKLQGRLQQPAPVKRKVYYFRAAAILLFLLVISFVLIQRKKTSTADTIVSIQPAVKTELPAVAKKENSTTPIKTVTSPVKEKHFTTLKPVQEKLIPEPVIEKEEIINDDPAPLAQVQPVSPAQSPDVPAPKKKKLKVVHMNELNAPPPPAFATLKEEWSQPPPSTSPSEEFITPPSIWPGKNKNRTSISLGN